MPVDTFKHGFRRAQLIKEHDENALKGHWIEIGAIFLMLDANANDNAKDLVQ